VCFVQRFRSASGREVHGKWARLLDKLTIAGHSHQTAAELYTEITDHTPLLMEVSHHMTCLTLGPDLYPAVDIQGPLTLMLTFSLW